MALQSINEPIVERDAMLRSPFSELLPRRWRQSLWLQRLLVTQNLAFSLFTRAYLGAVLIHYAKRWSEPEYTLLFLGIFLVSLVNFRELVTFTAGNLTVILVESDGFPRLANHTNLALFVGIFVTTALVTSAIRKERFPEPLIVNSLRAMALVLYFYVGFHKINEGFLTLNSSCTTWFHDRIERTLFDGATIIPELIREISPVTLIAMDLSVVALLLFPRTWLWGLFVALPIHLYVSLSGFTDFSAMMHAIMLLFLPPRFWQVLRLRPELNRMFMRSMAIYAIGIVIYVTYSGLAHHHWYLQQEQITTYLGLFYNFLVLELALVVVYVMMRGHRSSLKGAIGIGSNTWQLWNKYHVVFPLLVFVWGAFPYLFGAQTSFTMFSNLVTERERQNHLLVNTKLTKIIDFEEDLVSIGLIYSQSRPPARYDIQGYLLPMSEFKYLASISTKDPADPITLDISLGGNEMHIDHLGLSKFARRPVSSYFLTFRQIDPYGVSKCRW